MVKKHFAALAVCIVLAVLIVANLGSAADVITINFWHTYSSTNLEVKTLRESVIPAFEKENPGITVKDLIVPYEDLKRKLLAGAAAGTNPELIRMDIVTVPQFARLGLLEPVSKTYASEFNKMKGGFFPGPLATNYWKGTYYGIPLDTNTKVLFYSKTLLAKAGLSKPPETWDEFFAAAKAVAGGSGADRIYGFGDGWADPWFLTPLLYSNGGAVTNSKYTKATGYLNSPKSFEILNKMVQANKAGICLRFQGGDPAPFALMDAGRCLFTIDGPWYVGIIKGQWPKMEYGMALLPHGTGAQSASVTGGEDIVMVKGVPKVNKAAAWKFIKFITSDWAQVEMAKSTQIPVTNTAAAKLTGEEFDYLKIYFEQLKTAVARTPHPGYDEIKQSLVADLMPVVKEGKEGKDLQAVLDLAAKHIDAILAKPEYN